MKIDFKKIIAEFAFHQTPPDFRTHANYVEFMKKLSSRVGIECARKISSRIPKSKKVDKKLGLIKLTLQSIDGEYKTIRKNPEFAELCVSWISVKTYYLLFNLCLIADYLLDNDTLYNMIEVSF